MNHRAWAFQLAFENARELVRWTVCEHTQCPNMYETNIVLGNTFKEWRDNWAMKGKDVARVHVQQAYSQAPEDLKLAVGMWLDYVPEITYNR